MTQRAHRAAKVTGSASASRGRLATTLAAVKQRLETLVRIFAPHQTPRQRYQRRHRPLAGPRPGARLG